MKTKNTPDLYIEIDPANNPAFAVFFANIPADIPEWENVGRTVRFIGGQAGGKSRGLIHNLLHRITGIQRIFDGSYAYRVHAIEGDNFGHVARFDEVEFLP